MCSRLRELCRMFIDLISGCSMVYCCIYYDSQYKTIDNSPVLSEDNQYHSTSIFTHYVGKQEQFGNFSKMEIFPLGA